MIRNNIISYNTSYLYGGGLVGCNGTIHSNTIYGNSANSAGGGLAYCSGRLSIIGNCIIWQNSAPAAAQLYGCTSPYYSCIQDWTGGTGNISNNPQLAEPAYNDFHLLPHSPCIDAGGTVTLSIDYDGDIRPWDGTSKPRGDGSDFDMGADEFIGRVWTFELPPEGWSYQTAWPPPDIPDWSHATSLTLPGAIGLATPADETNDYYGSWDNYSGDSNIPAVCWVDNSAWRAKFIMSTDKLDPSTVPSIRFRLALNHMKATSYMQVLPGGWLPIAERGIGTTGYKLYLLPPIIDNGFFLAFDLIDFGQPFGVPCDGTVYLEEVIVERVDLTELHLDDYWTTVTTYSGTELHSWTHSSAGVPYLTDVNGYSQPADGLEQNTTMAQTRAFGAWTSPAQIDLVADQLYRAVWTLACDDSSLGGANRIRTHTQDFRYSSYMVVDRDADRANSALPPATGSNYFIYAEFPATPTVDKLLLAWDLYDFDPAAGGWARLKDVVVSRRELP